MTAPAATEAPAKSPWWLAVRVLDEPGAVFAELAARPRALIPIILILIVMVGTAIGMPTRVLRSATERQLQTIEQRHPGALTPEARERAMARTGSPITRVTIFLGGTVTSLVMLLIVAGALRLVFNGLSQDPISFRHEWAIATHAYVPQILGAIATVVAVAVLNDAQFRFSLGLLFNPDSGSFTYHLANQFGLFGAWNVYLLALGNQIKTKAKGIGTPLAIVGSLWIVANLLLAGLQSMFGGLMG
jgi:Yip1 domain